MFIWNWMVEVAAKNIWHCDMDNWLSSHCTSPIYAVPGDLWQPFILFNCIMPIVITMWHRHSSISVMGNARAAHLDDVIRSVVLLQQCYATHSKELSQHSVTHLNDLSYMPLCISMISGVCVQGMWNAQVKGQVTETHRLKVNSHCDTALFISMYDITMVQP